MVNTIAHELFEAVTDPVVYDPVTGRFRYAGWYDDETGTEAADLCAWQFGTTTTTNFNVNIGSRQYLLQQLWANDGVGRCALSYP
jgi:hypothetical protein